MIASQGRVSEAVTMLSVNYDAVQQQIHSTLEIMHSVGSSFDGHMVCRLMGASLQGLICRYPSRLKQRQQHADSPNRLSSSIKTGSEPTYSAQLELGLDRVQLI